MSSMKPNVIFVLTDDQGYGDLSCTGNPDIRTPEIDRFYSDSIRLTDYHVAPLCAPSRGALFTGRRPFRNGVWATCWGRSILREGETTLAELFSRNGYATGLFGKWHLGDNYPYRPQDRGFDTVLAHKGGGVGQTPDFWGNNYFDDIYYRDGKPTQCEGYCTDVWFKAAEKFIEQHLNQPFFACIATNAPHEPYLVSEKYIAQYKGNNRIVHPEFYGMISNIDENFGKLCHKMVEWGIEDNTILIFMTDNGSSGCSELDKNEFVIRGYNAGMRGMKASYYEGGHRVPFFIRWPRGGLQGGHDVNYTAFHVDFLPTLVDLCHLDMPPLVLDGISLRDALYGQGNLPAERIEFMQYHQSYHAPEKWNCAVISDQWRLVYGKELYNIRKDPEQRNDIAANNPRIVEKLRQAYNKQWEEMQRNFEVVSAIYLGDDHENPTCLNAMDVMGDVAWSQLAVALAQKSSGKWHVKFTRPGQYHFGLRRWPEELKMPMNEQLSLKEMQELALYWGTVQYWKENGDPDNCHFVRAGLKLFGEHWEKDMDPSDIEAEFTIYVDKIGETDLSAWFADETGEKKGAYYVYVQWQDNAQNQ